MVGGGGFTPKRCVRDALVLSTCPYDQAYDEIRVLGMVYL